MQNIKRTFQILLNTKHVWSFSALIILCSVLYSSIPSIFQILSDPLWLICLYLGITFTIGFVYIVANGSLIFVIFQASLSKSLSFSVAWAKGRSRLFRILGVFFLWLAVPLLAGLCSKIITSSITIREVIIPLMWILTIVSNIFYDPFLIFVLSALMIDNLKILPAVRTGLQTTFNNFLRLLVIIAVLGLTRFLVNALVLEYFTPEIFKTDIVISSLLIPTSGGNQSLMSIPSLGIANMIMTLLFFPWIRVFFTLEYIKSTEETVSSNQSHLCL